MTTPTMPPRSKQDVVDLLFEVQAGHRSCGNAADLLFPQLRWRRIEQQEVGEYSYDESRVVEYLASIMPDVGAGFDPIGFLIASHHSIAAERLSGYEKGLTEGAEIAEAFARGQRQMAEEEGSDEGLIAGETTATFIRDAILRRIRKG